jgi:hypothetical protein
MGSNKKALNPDGIKDFDVGAHDAVWRLSTLA